MRIDNLENTTRNAVRAIIIREGQLLVQKKTDGSFSLPGGAPNVEETLEQGLIRECEEEIGTSINTIRLVHVADYFKPRKSNPPAIRHHIEFFFVCSVAQNYMAHNGPHPDKRQIKQPRKDNSLCTYYLLLKCSSGSMVRSTTLRMIKLD